MSYVSYGFFIVPIENEELVRNLLLDTENYNIEIIGEFEPTADDISSSFSLPKSVATFLFERKAMTGLIVKTETTEHSLIDTIENVIYALT